MVSREDIATWFKSAREQQATHMLVISDDFAYECYPVFVSAQQDVRKVAQDYEQKSMTTLMECYAIHLDLESQLEEHRAFHYENPPLRQHIDAVVELDGTIG